MRTPRRFSQDICSGCDYFTKGITAARPGKRLIIQSPHSHSPSPTADGFGEIPNGHGRIPFGEHSYRVRASARIRPGERVNNMVNATKSSRKLGRSCTKDPWRSVRNVIVYANILSAARLRLSAQVAAARGGSTANRPKHRVRPDE